MPNNREFDNFSDLVDALVSDITDDTISEIQHQIVTEKLVFTRQLLESWEKVKIKNGEYMIGSELIWAKVQDEGRTPGKMPPIADLMPWVMDKMPDIKNSKQAKSRAFAVAKKIAEKGTEPRHYIKKALFTMEQRSQ